MALLHQRHLSRKSSWKSQWLQQFNGEILKVPEIWDGKSPISSALRRAAYWERVWTSEVLFTKEFGVVQKEGIPYTPNNRPTVSGLFFCFLTLISDILNFPSKINSWRFWNVSLGRNEHKKNWNPRSTIKSLVRGFWKGRLEKKTRSQGFQDAPSELPFGMFVIFRTLWKERNTVTVEHSGTL